jgi:HEAT repeat protein
MVRSVNTGISGFIDSTGRASNRVPVRTEGSAVQRLALDARVTFYMRYGDVFAGACLLVASIAVFGRIGIRVWNRRLSMKRAALFLIGLMAMGSLWACQSTPSAKDQQARLTKTNDPDPPPPLVPTPIRPELQSRARAQLVAAAGSTDAVVRTNALAAMVDSMGQEAAPQFLAALDDPDPVARFAATIAAGRLKLEAAHDKLLVLAVGGDPSVNVGAIFALHQLGDYRYSHELEKTAFSPLPTVKADTAVVLGLIGDPSALPYLAILVSDPDVGVQQQAAAALWRFHDQRGLDVLSAKLISKYPDDQIFALVALAEPGDPRVRGQVRGQLSTWPPEVQLTAARALGMLHSDAGYSLGIKYATSADETERVFAAEALGAIGRSDAQSTLAKLLDDPSAQVKLAASAAIIQLGAGK